MVNFAGVIFASAFMLFFVLLFVRAYRFGAVGALMPDRKNLRIFWVLAFAGGCVCYYMLVQNKYVYIWDYGGYWTHSYSQMQILFSRPLLAVLRLGGSIFFSDYNSILPTLLAFPLKLFGYTFTRYVLVNYAVFLVPVFFLLWVLLKSLAGKKYAGLSLFLAVMFSPVYLAMLRGYIDIACLIPAVIALVLFNDYDALSFTREQIKRDVYISSMLLCTLMFRRYFVFYVQGYMTALAVWSAYSVLKNPSVPKLRAVRNAVLNIAVIGVFALLVMLIFFAPMLHHILTRSYADMYASYDAPMPDKIIGVLNFYGYFVFIFAALGGIVSLCVKKMRRYICFCAVCLAVTAATFFHVQAMDIHHFYTLAVPLFIMSGTGIILFSEMFTGKALRNSALMLCVLVVCANFANCFMPEVRQILGRAGHFFSRVHTPLIRNDIPQLNELCDYLNSKTAGTEKSICIMSGGALNYSVMDALRKPYETQPVHNLYKTLHIDLRDGFPVELLKAEIIVISEPVKSDQENVRFISRELMDSTSRISRHFVKDSRTFALDGGTTVYIFEKQSDFEQEDLQYMADYYARVYPGHEAIFADRILGRAEISEALGHKWSPKVITVLRWLMRKGLFTPEELAFATNRTTQEMMSIYIEK